MKKNKIVLGFAKLTDLRLEEKAKAVLISMEGNSNFKKPDPSLTELRADIHAFSQALANSNGIIKKEKRLCLEVTLSNLAYNVSFAANNDYNKLISSGFDVHKAEDYKQVKQNEKSKVVLQKNHEQNVATFLFHPATA